MKHFTEDNEHPDNDIYDANFQMLDPFEYEIDDRPELAKELDKSSSILMRLAKLAIGVSLLFGISSLLPGVFKFFILLGKEFMHWVSRLF